MSVRNRRRRSEQQLLDTARSILWTEGSEEEAEPETTRADTGADQATHPAQPDEPDNQMDQMEQITALTQALQLAGRPSFKPPSFSGEEDVELFLKQFGDVAEANRWSALERTLHLRSQLSGDAHSCGQGEDWQEIAEDLRARYGLTRGRARDMLSGMQLKTGQNVHKQAAEITRLVALAFPILPEGDQRAMALDYFNRSWESKGVQQHLLAVRPTSMREAVRATEDFLSIQSSGPRPRAHAVEPMEDESTPTGQMEAGLAALAEAIHSQTTLLQQVVLQMGQRQMTYLPPPAQIQDQQLKCYECGGPHYKRNCPSRRPASNQTQQAGNGRGPAQV